MCLIIVLYLNNECAPFWQWRLSQPWQQKCTPACHLAVPVTACRPARSSASLQGAMLLPLSFNRADFLYLSLGRLRSKERILMQINVSWPRMRQPPPLGLSYLLFTPYSLWDANSPDNSCAADESGNALLGLERGQRVQHNKHSKREKSVKLLLWNIRNLSFLADHLKTQFGVKSQLGVQTPESLSLSAACLWSYVFRDPETHPT